MTRSIQSSPSHRVHDSSPGYEMPEVTGGRWSPFESGAGWLTSRPAQPRRGGVAGCTLEVGLRPGGSTGSTERQVQAERGTGCVHLQRVSFQNGGGVGNSASAQGPHPPGGGLSLLLRVGQEATRVSIPTLARPRPGLLMLAESAFFFWKLPTCQADREGEDVLSCSDAAYGPGHGWPPRQVWREGTPSPASAGEGSLSDNRRGLWRDTLPGAGRLPGARRRGGRRVGAGGLSGERCPAPAPPPARLPGLSLGAAPSPAPASPAPARTPVQTSARQPGKRPLCAQLGTGAPASPSAAAPAWLPRARPGHCSRGPCTPATRLRADDPRSQRQRPCSCPGGRSRLGSSLGCAPSRPWTSNQDVQVGQPAGDSGPGGPPSAWRHCGPPGQ